MAIWGFDDLLIELDDAGSTAKDISQYVVGDFSVQKNAINEQVDGAGETIDRYAFVGMFTREPISLEGPLDDTANGLYDILKNWTDGSERTVSITWDDPTAADVVVYQALLENVQKTGTRGGLSRITASLRFTGVEA